MAVMAAPIAVNPRRSFLLNLENVLPTLPMRVLKLLMPALILDSAGVTLSSPLNLILTDSTMFCYSSFLPRPRRNLAPSPCFFHLLVSLFDILIIRC
jgi:hypothetical protein